MLDSYKDMLKGYFKTSGKVDRHNYWLGILIMLIIMSVLIWFADRIAILHFAPYAFAVAMIVPTATATVRRLHDVGKRGFWALLALIPAVGWICLFVFLIQETASEEEVKQKHLVAPRLGGGYGN